ncbi:OLC1v1027165C1 [Oldenlandia corymbosa var. corymbosa]|uniref:OLC1v1027165C1 n=1 Tax=Oldenlandia corymbosa var. corymbosa TaxID=529605 RepID=A0AAV1C8U7_OLDCO|nr:OLC1v1027165C1 [Oldenlandia corymbosa var. corymbosa]
MEKRNGKSPANQLTSSPAQTRIMRDLKSGPLASLKRSSSKSSSKSVEINAKPTTSSTKKKKLQESVDDYAQIRVRSQPEPPVPRRCRSASTSPSAWALSPGRSLHPLPVVPKSPVITTSEKLKRDLISGSSSRKGSISSTTGVTVSGVLKYISNKIKKVSPVQEEEYHQFRLMHNRLLQWRFVNARAEVSMSAVKRNAEKKSFNAWLKMSRMRSFVVGKRTELQRLKLEIKLYRIISSEIHLLREWARIESRNFEAVGRLATKLSIISLCFPLGQGAKGDVTSILDAIGMATKVMDNIEATIRNIESKVNMSFIGDYQNVFIRHSLKHAM